MSEHYFSPAPGGPAPRRTLRVVLAGHETEVVTAPGVFSADRLDLGTQVLLRSVPDPPATGDLLDLGCGWGPLSLVLARRSPGAQVWAVDVNPRARELTAQNAARAGLPNIGVLAPEEIDPGLRFAALWSNPPIRVGKAALHALLLQWLPRLATPACAHLVVQRHLGADSLQAWLTGVLPEHEAGGGPLEVSRAASAKGYRVLRVCRTEPGQPSEPG